MGIWLGPMGGSVAKASDIEYSGIKQFVGSKGAWELALESGGTLKFTKDPGLCDVWVLDGGANGGTGEISDGYIYSGKGGDGGLHKLHSSVRLRRGVSYTVVVGNAGATSSLVGGGQTLNATGGNKSNGGTAAKMVQEPANDPDPINTGGVGGSYPFEDASTSLISDYSGKKLGAGGGAGDAVSKSYVWTDLKTGRSISGGDDGGGDGGTKNAKNGTNATLPGSGGGGGFGDGVYGQHGTAGSGAPGLIMIRNHREPTQTETPST